MPARSREFSHCFDSRGRNHARLIENVFLNKLANVQVRKLGVGAQTGLGLLHFTAAMAGGGSFPESNAAGPQGDGAAFTAHRDHDTR